MFCSCGACERSGHDNCVPMQALFFMARSPKGSKHFQHLHPHISLFDSPPKKRINLPKPTPPPPTKKELTTPLTPTPASSELGSHLAGASGGHGQPGRVPARLVGLLGNGHPPGRVQKSKIGSRNLGQSQAILGNLGDDHC